MRRPLSPLLFWPALVVLGCWGAKDNELFAIAGTQSVAGASAGGSSGAQSGTDSSSSSESQQGGKAVVGGGGGAGNVSSTSADGGGEAKAGTNGAGGTSEPTALESCDSVAGAVASDLNGHCYRTSTGDLTFAAARDACRANGGYLVTVTSQAENDFVHALHDGEHWIGATDGRPDMVAGVGPYAWVDDEPFDYADWQDGQPNAFNTTCPGQTGTPKCFEHCAFQTDDGAWNDRSCWHTIASICEWDVKAPAGAAGSTP